MENLTASINSFVEFRHKMIESPHLFTYHKTFLIESYGVVNQNDMQLKYILRFP